MIARRLWIDFRLHERRATFWRSLRELGSAVSKNPWASFATERRGVWSRRNSARNAYWQSGGLGGVGVLPLGGKSRLAQNDSR